MVASVSGPFHQRRPRFFRSEVLWPAERVAQMFEFRSSNGQNGTSFCAKQDERQGKPASAGDETSTRG